MTSNVNGAAMRPKDSSKMTAIRQEFDAEKAAALVACQNHPELLAQVNAITPHKGAIEELEDLINQAIELENTASSKNTLNVLA